MKKTKGKNNNDFAMIAMVAIVAIVGIVMMFMNTGTPAYATTSELQNPALISGVNEGNINIIGNAASGDQMAIGSLDAANCDYFGGWAFDPDKKEQPVAIHFYLDGKFFTYTVANRTRADITKAYGVNAAYHINLNAEQKNKLADGKTHTITAYAIGITNTNTLSNTNPPIGTKTTDICVATCTDSDNGADYYVKGTVHLPNLDYVDKCVVPVAADAEYFYATKDNVRYQYNSWNNDSCDAGNNCYLAEATCKAVTDSDVGSDFEVGSCPNGCKDGACIKPCSVDARECTSLNYPYMMYGLVGYGPIWNGKEYTTQKICNIIPEGCKENCVGSTWSFEQPDCSKINEISSCPAGFKCYDSNSKYYLSNDCKWSSFENCPNGCKDGACIIPVCGNEILDADEECDNTNLNEKTCTNLGFIAGTLKCSKCKFNTTQCIIESIPPTSCTDSDGGANYYVKGNTVYGDLFDWTDGCRDSKLTEYYCGSVVHDDGYFLLKGPSAAIELRYMSYNAADRAVTIKVRYSGSDIVASVDTDNSFKIPYDGVEYAFEIVSSSSNVVDIKAVGATKIMLYDNINCPYGCEDGACIIESVPPVASCTDNDASDPYRIYIKSKVTGTDSNGNSYSKPDACDTSKILKEMMCYENTPLTMYVNCPGTCSNGACV